jgi:hypothetical protein
MRNLRQWKPSPKQLEIIAMMGHAHLPLKRIAEAIGCDKQVFRDWLFRIAAAIDPEDNFL